MKLSKYLFKFYTPSLGKKAIEDILSGKIWVSNPIAFNDPFDCNLGIDCTNATLEELSQLAVKIFKLGGLESRTDELLNEIITTDVQASRDKFTGILANISTELSSKIGVLCLSEDPSEILMWSHYAENHAGIALIFEPNIFKISSHSIAPVSYSESFPPSELFTETLSSSSSHELDDLLLRRKALAWAYEREWRLLCHLNEAWGKNISGGYVNCNKDVLKGVIFGANIKNTDHQEILSILKENTLRDDLIVVSSHKSKKGFYIEIDGYLPREIQFLNLEREMDSIISNVIWYPIKVISSLNDKLDSSEESIPLLLFFKILELFETIWMLLKVGRYESADILITYMKKLSFLTLSCLQSTENIKNFLLLKNNKFLTQISQMKEDPNIWDNYIECHNTSNEALIKKEEQFLKEIGDVDLSLRAFAKTSGSLDLYLSDYLAGEDSLLDEFGHLSLSKTKNQAVSRVKVETLPERVRQLSLPWFYFKETLTKLFKTHNVESVDKITNFEKSFMTVSDKIKTISEELKEND